MPHLYQMNSLQLSQKKISYNTKTAE